MLSELYDLTPTLSPNNCFDIKKDLETRILVELIMYLRNTRFSNIPSHSLSTKLT